MHKVPTLVEGMYLLDKKPTHASGYLVIHNNFIGAYGASRGQVIQISALSAFDGSVVDYHGINGWRRIRVRFRRGSLSVQ